jgi:hypothetical protein
LGCKVLGVYREEILGIQREEGVHTEWILVIRRKEVLTWVIGYRKKGFLGYGKKEVLALA